MGQCWVKNSPVLNAVVSLNGFQSAGLAVRPLFSLSCFFQEYA